MMCLTGQMVVCMELSVLLVGNESIDEPVECWWVLVQYNNDNCKNRTAMLRQVANALYNTKENSLKCSDLEL